jgi:hypothetical protein
VKDVITLMEGVTKEEIQELNSELPTDVHLIEFVRGQELYVDAVRAYKKVDIFNVYYDKLNAEARQGLISNFEIRSITSGFGSIKPKLFNG